MKHGRLYLIGLFLISILSCKKEMRLTPPFEQVTFYQTDQEKKLVEINKEVAAIIQEVYFNRKAFHEVNAAIYSGYYEDERVLLRDLLMPEISPLYKTESYIKLKAESGAFKKEFYEVLNRGNYPNVKHQLYGTSVGEVLSNTPESVGMATPTDTSKEIFSKTNGVCVYFPYSENFGSTFTSTYFDNINTNTRGKTATIVAADREADSGPGQEPYICGTRDYPKFCYRTVTVNDAYAEISPTHIVGVSAEVADMLPHDPPPVGTQIEKVYHGHSRLTKQLDRFISLSNGGGSEIKISRISGYLQMQDQQVTNFAQDIVTVHYKRKDIKKERFKRVYSVWDPYWKPDNLEQVYAVWEDDTQGTNTFTGSLVTTVTAAPGQTAVQTLTYNVQVKTQDEIVTQRRQDRYAYFRDAKNNQGCGYVADSNDFLPVGHDWPQTDCSAIWTYTWPYRLY